MVLVNRVQVSYFAVELKDNERQLPMAEIFAVKTLGLSTVSKAKSFRSVTPKQVCKLTSTKPKSRMGFHFAFFSCCLQ